jgi:large subunit ribosomal protein L17
LILHKRIKTTTAKAKALKVFVEPLITKAKNDTTHSRRMVFSYLKSKTAVSELFRDVAEKIGDRPGGYTRILKTGNRLGDNAETCIIELVDFNENMLAAKETKTKSRRSRRGSSKKAETEAPAAKAKEAPAAKEAPTAKVEETTVAKEVPAAKVEETTAATTEETPAVEEPTTEAPATENEEPKAE